MPPKSVNAKKTKMVSWYCDKCDKTVSTHKGSPVKLQIMRHDSKVCRLINVPNEECPVCGMKRTGRLGDPTIKAIAALVGDSVIDIPDTDVDYEELISYISKFFKSKKIKNNL